MSRGLHCDFKSWKMITSVYGKFCLYCRYEKKLKNYLQYKKIIFDYNKPKIILIPPYYANGHLCLSKVCLFHYKWSYKENILTQKNKKHIYGDPKINIKWPIKTNFGKRDKEAKKFKICKKF